jgi:hypothetical protein
VCPRARAKEAGDAADPADALGEVDGSMLFGAVRDAAVQDHLTLPHRYIDLGGVDLAVVSKALAHVFEDTVVCARVALGAFAVVTG